MDLQSAFLLSSPVAFIITGTAVAIFILKMAAYAALSVALGYIAAGLLAEDTAGAPGTLENFDLPTTEQGRAIQVIFGSPRVRGYNDIWHGDLRTSKIKERAGFSKVTVGYYYYLGFHYAWCAYAEELIELRMDEETLISTPVTSNAIIEIDDRDLFGGKKKQGGVEGDLAIMFGGSTQPVNPYLNSTLGTGGVLPVPAFRGMVTTVSQQMYIGTTTNMKTMDAIWRRTTKTNRGETIWYSAKAQITDSNGIKGMNVAHIAHEIITDPDYSLGFASGIDDTNFRAAANTLYDEGFGLSFVLDVAKNGAKVLNEIVGYANGFLRVDVTTNKYQIKLMRDDFDIEDLDIVDESIVSMLTKITRDTSTEIHNQVSVTYTDPDTRKPATLTAQNTALIEAYGTVVNRDTSAPAVHSPDLANRIATNALRSIGVNPFTATISGNRELTKYNLGDAFRLQLPSEGLSDVVVRVMDTDYGDLVNGTVKLTLQQDVFKAGEAIFGDPDESLWEDTAEPPTELTIKSVIELPYYNLATDVLGASAASLLATEAGRPAISGVRTVQNNTTFDTWAKLSTDADYSLNTEDAGFCAYCKTASSISFGVTQLTIGYTDESGLQDVAVGESTWCQIGDEILKVIDIDTTSSELTLERGCLDTVPVAHASGVDVLFVSDSYITGTAEFGNGQTVDVKILPASTIGELEIGDVGADSLTMNKRYIRPYNGANFAGASSANDIDFSWAHRNRILNVQNIVIQSETGIAAEAGATYTFTAKDGGTTVRTVSGITGEGYTYAEADLIADFGSVANAKSSSATYFLKATRDGHDSWQEWEFDGTYVS